MQRHKRSLVCNYFSLLLTKPETLSFLWKHWNRSTMLPGGRRPHAFALAQTSCLMFTLLSLSKPLWVQRPGLSPENLKQTSTTNTQRRNTQRTKQSLHTDRVQQVAMTKNCQPRSTTFHSTLFWSGQ